MARGRNRSERSAIYLFHIYKSVIPSESEDLRTKQAANIALPEPRQPDTSPSFYLPEVLAFARMTA
jgi:hypothetical protein